MAREAIAKGQSVKGQSMKKTVREWLIVRGYLDKYTLWKRRLKLTMKDIKKDSILKHSILEVAFSLAPGKSKAQFLEDSNCKITFCGPSVYRVQIEIIKSLLQS